MVESREPDDPWKGRQPRYEKLRYRAPNSFSLVARLPSGVPIEVKLGRLEPPQPRPPG